MPEHGGRKWWVLGCGGLLGLVILAIAIVAGRTWWSVRSADRQSDRLTLERATVETGQAAGQPSQTSELAPQATGTPLTVLLELDSAEVYIEPAAPGEPLDVEAHYDAHDYRLEEIVEPETPDAYHLKFVVTSSRFITGIKQGIRGGQPQLRVRLPRDTPLDLKLVQRNGGAFVDLGGLHVTSADFDAGGAILKIDADERLQGELESFTIKGRQGGLFVESLNLMQPRHVGLDFRMGQATLDFRGPWAADTEVELSMSMTDAILRLPRDARVEGLDTSPTAPAFREELRPATLRFTLETGRRTSLRLFE